MKKNLKRVKKIAKKLLKKLIKNAILLIIGFIYVCYWGFNSFNKKVAKTFKSFPSKARIALIYLLVIGNLPNVFATIELVETLNKENVVIEYIEVEKVVEKETTKTEEIKVEEVEETCNFDLEIECKIYTKAIEIGLTHDQAIIALAISKHETGKWTSRIYKEQNNVGGIYNSRKKTFYTYKTQDEGVEAFVSLLKRGYFDQGYTTIKKIQKKYAPLNAKNDPKGLNNHWVSGVSHYYEQYTESK